jgi:hypothetical protein
VQTVGACRSSIAAVAGTIAAPRYHREFDMRDQAQHGVVVDDAVADDVDDLAFILQLT